MLSKSDSVMRYERDYYPCVAHWFETQKGCTSAGAHIFCKSALLSADIVGWVQNEAIFACEMKPYPLPIGASGYGSVGQALMLKRYAKYVYVACVASDIEELVRGQVIHWKKVVQKSSIICLLKAVGLDLPKGFSDYCESAKIIFQTFFSGLNLGLLIVHEKDSAQDPSTSYDVIELVKPAAF